MLDEENWHLKAKVKQSANSQFPKSDDHLEKIVFDDARMPEGYTFVPKRNLYIIRKCRGMTKDSAQVVYKIFDNTDREYLGIRVPADILEEARNRSEETQESRAAATEARGTKYLNETRRLLLNQFPMTPQRDLEAVLEHSFANGSGRVGRTALFLTARERSWLPRPISDTTAPPTTPLLKVACLSTWLTTGSWQPRKVFEKPGRGMQRTR